MSAAAGHVWFYQSISVIGSTSTIGPISEQELLSLARDGELSRATLVSSQSRTGGGWHQAAQIPGLLKTIEEGERDRHSEKARRQEQEDTRRQTVDAARRAERQRTDSQRAQFAVEATRISDCQDVELVSTIRERVQGILTANETVEFIVVQQKPIINISPDAVVCTSRRLIFYRPKILGRFEFQDYLWFDLFNAHMKQNLLGAVFTAQHVSGQWLSMDYLPTVGAQRLYRIAQEREEQARLARHRLHLDTARAGAANVNVQTNVPTSAPIANTASTSDDLIKRMETLKTMADKGLITSEEFAQRKAEILAKL